MEEHKHPYPPEGTWREIKIPVDVPYMNVSFLYCSSPLIALTKLRKIVAAARIRILPTPFSESSSSPALPLYAGQPISANLTIQTSLHWGSSAGDKERQYMLRYDVEELVRDWLVSGPKRGDFAAMVCQYNL